LDACKPFVSDSKTKLGTIKIA